MLGEVQVTFRECFKSPNLGQVRVRGRSDDGQVNLLTQSELEIHCHCGCETCPQYSQPHRKEV